MPAPKLTKSIDGRERMTIKIQHRLTPVDFTEYVAAHLHESSDEKPPRTRKALTEIVRTSLAQQGRYQHLDYDDDDYFSARELVDKAFPEFKMTAEDTPEREFTLAREAYQTRPRKKSTKKASDAESEKRESST